MDVVWAPWDEDFVKAMNRFQTDGDFHPYTCGNGEHDWWDRSLVATRDGWICPKDGCDYAQEWAWR